MIRDEAEIARSAIEARKTVLSWAEVLRYLDPPANTAFSLEYAFHLLGDVQDKHVLALGCGTGENKSSLSPGVAPMSSELTFLRI